MRPLQDHDPAPSRPRPAGRWHQGAFTWGVLDRLLEDERLQLAAISGTSAGAMNAVALASGWATDGRRGAREALRNFWSRVAEGLRLGNWVDAWLGWGQAAGAPGAVPSPMQMAWDMASTLLAPVHADPAVHNPLHAILRDTVDFDAVRGCRDLKLFVAATHVRSGRQRVWRRAELGIEAVLASACLPALFPAVEVDGEAYWDGGYMGNPRCCRCSPRPHAGPDAGAGAPQRPQRSAAGRRRGAGPHQRDHFPRQPGQGTALAGHPAQADPRRRPGRPPLPRTAVPQGRRAARAPHRRRREARRAGLRRPALSGLAPPAGAAPCRPRGGRYLADRPLHPPGAARHGRPGGRLPGRRRAQWAPACGSGAAARAPG
ncbi:MAG: patatin-like phospholipase family protein [Betaproteobacteria bacterium]|nr:patatin-like phospholipase family protein [Betaproteobacteria bacterium]